MFDLKIPVNTRVQIAPDYEVEGIVTGHAFSYLSNGMAAPVYIILFDGIVDPSATVTTKKGNKVPFGLVAVAPSLVRRA